MNTRLAIKKYLGALAVMALIPACSWATEHLIKPVDTKKLIGKMVDAGIIDTNSRVYISYSIRGIFINGTHLANAAELQWKRVFTEAGIPAPLQDNDGTDITVIPSAPPSMKKAKSLQPSHADTPPGPKA